MAKISIKEIKELANEKNWELLSDVYKNLDTPLTFKCSEGHQILLPYKKVRNRWLCPVCNQNTFFQMDEKVLAKPKGARRIIALDQSTHITGYSIYDNKELIKYGIFEVDGEDEISRDHTLKNWLVSMIKIWNADGVGLEGIQYQTKIGVTTFETLARLQGILMETCYELQIPYKICPTNTWRKETGVKGRARTDRKRSAQLIIKNLYDVTVTEDEADAILIGKYASDHFGIKPKIIQWEDE